jgi:hypothetical protein
MKLRWHCGAEIDQAKCAGTGEVNLTAYQTEAWHDDLAPTVQCGECGAVLGDTSHYEVVEVESPRVCPEMDFEPPYPDEVFETSDYVLYEGGAWRVVKATMDEFDEREQKLDIEWVGGPRMGKLVYATGVRSSEVRSLTEMEVIAVVSR